VVRFTGYLVTTRIVWIDDKPMTLTEFYMQKIEKSSACGRHTLSEINELRAQIMVVGHEIQKENPKG
jgi:hypothetical protein